MIEVVHATKFYRGAVALRHVNLKFKRGEIVALLGENGAGKTTLLKAIMGLTPLSMGSVALDAAEIRKKAYEKISFITEESSLFSNLTAMEHAEFYHAMFPRFNPLRFESLLSMFGVPVNKKARALSRGIKQKLEIAIGMSKAADFILMDEPFLGEDVFARRDLIKLLITECSEDVCFIISTHQIQEIEPLVSRVVVLREGGVVADEDVEALHERGETLITMVKRLYGYDEIHMAQKG